MRRASIIGQMGIQKLIMFDSAETPLHNVRLVQSRIDEVVIGCMNPKAGCAGSVMNLLQIEGFNHQVKITEGVLEEECSEMLSAFFRELREKKKQAKILKKQEAERLAGQQTQTDGTE